MKNFRKNNTSAYLTLLLCPLLLLAQAEMSPLQLRTLALDSTPIKGLFIANSHGYEELTFSVYQPSTAFTAKASESLPIYHRKINEAGKSEYVLFKELPLPQTGRRILLIGHQSGTESRLVTIRDNFGEGDNQDWLLVNASSTTLAFQVGDLDPISVPARQSTPLRVNMPSGKGATVKVAARFDEAWKKFYSTFWPIYENQRCLVLFVPDGESIRVRNFFEVIESPKARADL